ncbi:hypothetical protein [Bradyrhizobium guangzhouense]|uniref:hypothetical protein n=1 Tax=Bradyrhizobium guangzhouense TaxID=1325095 RepID=UPI001009F7F6|nr:hypothetical protein [Bradyrhizobium guangzhouense]RXH15148.1 hypothetical protein EAS54_18845 [Bradyrhizobium guangzhouense]
MLPLDDRIKQIRDECNAIIDKHAAEIAAQTGNVVPVPSIRRDIELRARGCPCAQAMYVLHGEKAHEHLERT